MPYTLLLTVFQREGEEKSSLLSHTHTSLQPGNVIEHFSWRRTRDIESSEVPYTETCLLLTLQGEGWNPRFAFNVRGQQLSVLVFLFSFTAENNHPGDIFLPSAGSSRSGRRLISWASLPRSMRPAPRTTWFNIEPIRGVLIPLF